MKWLGDSTYRVVIVIFLSVIYMAVIEPDLAQINIWLILALAIIGVISGSMSGRD